MKVTLKVSVLADQIVFHVCFYLPIYGNPSNFNPSMKNHHRVGFPGGRRTTDSRLKPCSSTVVNTEDYFPGFPILEDSKPLKEAGLSEGSH